MKKEIRFTNEQANAISELLKKQANKIFDDIEKVYDKPIHAVEAVEKLGKLKEKWCCIDESKTKKRNDRNNK